jgi:hypothetical protein
MHLTVPCALARRLAVPCSLRALPRPPAALRPLAAAATRVPASLVLDEDLVTVDDELVERRRDSAHVGSIVQVGLPSSPAARGGTPAEMPHPWPCRVPAAPAAHASEPRVLAVH